MCENYLKEFFINYESHTASLPDSFLGEDRYFQIGYNFHGDIRIVTWSGQPMAEADNAEDFQGFGVHHGCDLTLMASLVGYFSRLNIGDHQAAEVFRLAAAEVLSDPEIVDEYYEEHRTYNEWLIDHMSKGLDFPVYDEDKLGLKCLAEPMSYTPRNIERVGGMGIYTRKHAIGQQVLVFAGLEPTHGFSTGEQLNTKYPIYGTVEFCEHDVPAMARVICDNSLGEYRKEIYAYVNDRFPE